MAHWTEKQAAQAALGVELQETNATDQDAALRAAKYLRPVEPLAYFYGPSPACWHTSTSYSGAAVAKLRGSPRSHVWAVEPHRQEWHPIRAAHWKDCVDMRAGIIDRVVPPIRAVTDDEVVGLGLLDADTLTKATP